VESKEETKYEYERPEVVDYGDLLDLTAGLKTGPATDATFPAHTPFANLTFS
jgi:hypothetical protein